MIHTFDNRRNIYLECSFAGTTTSTPLQIAKIAEPRGVSVLIPVGWNASVMWFSFSTDGITYYDLYDYNGQKVSITNISSIDNRIYQAPADLWEVFCFEYMKINSTVSQTIDLTVFFMS